jgi:branched-chain amino acid transport system substrate-binding protein
MNYKMLLILGMILALVTACGPVIPEDGAGEEEIVKTTIKIGSLIPMTGDVATLGNPIVDSIRLAVEETNDAGGIDGNMIELIEEDSRCEPKTATTGAEKLVNIDKVVGIVGAACSSATLAASPIAAGKTIMISPASTNPEVGKAGGHMFRTIGSDLLQGKATAQFAIDMKLGKAAVMYINNDYGVALNAVFVEELEALGGTVVISEAFDQGSADMKTQLAKVKNKAPKVVFVIGLPAECGILLKQKEELGMKNKFILSEGCKDPSVIEVAGNGAEGVMLTTPKPNTDASYEFFAAAYKAKYDRDPEAFTAEAYDAAKILIAGIANSDGTYAKVRDAVAATADYAGAAGTITFDENGDVDKPYALFKIIDGEFVEQE